MQLWQNRRVRGRLRSVVVAVIAVIAFANARVAFAADPPSGEAKLRCRAAYERGQQLKLEGHPSQARVALRVCSEACPPPFATDCDRWSKEIEALLPTVRLGARGASGERLDDVRVLVDGQLLADPLPLTAVTVDPGNHSFRFERAGFTPVEVRVNLEPGEREREVAVTIGESRQGPSSSNGGSNSEAGLALADGPRASRLPSYVFGGVGFAALALASGLAVKGHLDRSELADTCSPACDPAAADPIRTVWLASAIAAGAGVASFALALVFWPREKHPAREPMRAAASLVPIPGGGAVVGGSRFLEVRVASPAAARPNPVALEQTINHLLRDSGDLGRPRDVAAGCAEVRREIARLEALDDLIARRAKLASRAMMPRGRARRRLRSPPARSRRTP